MSEANILRAILTDIKLEQDILCNLLSQSNDAFVQYIQPLSCEPVPDDDFERPIILTEKDFSPVNQAWPDSLKAVYSFKTTPNRAPNSLPRYSGYIRVAPGMFDQVWKSTLNLNALKHRFAEEANAYYKNSDQKLSRTSMTSFLISEDIIDKTENYELITRKVLSSRDLVVKLTAEERKHPNSEKILLEKKRDYHFSADDELQKLAVYWLASPSSQPNKGQFEDIQHLIDNNDELMSLISDFERHQPGTEYCKVYFLPPSIRATYKFKSWSPSRQTISTPLILFEVSDTFDVSAELKPIEVMLHNGSVRSSESVARMNEKFTPVSNRHHWYARIKN